MVLPQPALAVITFTQLDDDFVVSHRVKVLGSGGQATRMIYEKAASLCVAAGYTHMKVLDQESNAGQQYEAANANARVQFFWEDAEDRLPCERGASPIYVQDAREKLARTGYVQPARVAPSESSGSEEARTIGSCTLEQIAAMARAGLSDEQILAACR